MTPTSNQPVPWIKFDFAQWLGGKVSRRPANEQAVFINLMTLMMREGGAVMMGAGDMLDMADRLHIEPDAVEAALRGLLSRSVIEKEDDLYSIKFLDEQFANVSEVRAKRVASGSKGGVAKSSKCLASASKCLASATDVVAKSSREREGVGEGEENEDKDTKKKIPPEDIKKPIDAEGAVMLSDKEYAKLCNGWGSGNAKKKYTPAQRDEAIDRLSSYLRQNNKKYKDHYAVLQGWCYDRIAEDSQQAAPTKRVYNIGPNGGMS